MEEYSQLEEASGEQRSSRRSFLRGEFLMDWLTRRRSTELNSGITKEDSGSRGMLLESPANIAIEGTAIFGGELKRHRHEFKLRQQLIGLKMGAPDLESEQREVIQKQAAFGEQLPGQDSELGDTELKQMELDRKRIDALLESRYQTSKEAGLKQLANTSPEAKPDEIFETAIEAAEQDIPIEGMRELRHERKDESDDVSSTTDEASYQLSTPSQPYFAPPSFSSISDITSSDYSNTQQSASLHPPDPSMYKQAIMAGFWTAIVIVSVGILFAYLSQ